ncbi:MAG: hypothetical protein WBN22_12910 [Verrucomicrobiia bacterium]
MTISFATPPPTPKRPTVQSPATPKAKAGQSINPYDGKTFKTFEGLTDAQLEPAIKTAATCFETWRNKTFASARFGTAGKPTKE